MFMSQYPEEHRWVYNQCLNFLSVSHLMSQINEGKPVVKRFLLHTKVTRPKLGWKTLSAGNTTVSTLSAGFAARLPRKSPAYQTTLFQAETS